MTDNTTLEYELYEIGLRETVVLRRWGTGNEWKRCDCGGRSERCC